jgi:hypothetical protein
VLQLEMEVYCFQRSLRPSLSRSQTKIHFNLNKDELERLQSEVDICIIRGNKFAADNNKDLPSYPVSTAL